MIRRTLRLARWACSIVAGLARDLRDARNTCIDCGCVIERGVCDCDAEGV